MGVHNRISETKYQQIKKTLKTPADDPKAMKAFGICAATARNIRNTASYQKYCERVFRYHGNPKKTKAYKTEPEVKKASLNEDSLDASWRQWEEIGKYAKQYHEPKPSVFGLLTLFMLVIMLAAFTVGLVWFSVNFLGDSK